MHSSKPLRVVLAPVGTWGDVIPLVALAHELRDRGHTPVFVAPEDGCEPIRAHDFSVVRTIRPFSSFLDQSQNEIKVLREVFRVAAEQFDALSGASEEADAIVGSMLQIAAPSIAECVGASYFYAMFSPTYLQTTTIPVPVPIGDRKVVISSPISIRLLWWLRDLFAPLAARELQQERAKLGLPPIRSVYEYLTRTGDLLLAFDPELTPIPDDIEFGHPTGHWPLEDPSPLSEELETFLAEGTPPVYIGFGSMVHGPTGDLRSLVERVLEELDLRAILASGVNGGPRSSRILVTGATPHRKLFPRTRLVVHHGGAGTLATAARSGVPQLIVPHLGDQYYHGDRVRKLGIGPAPLPLSQLSPSALKERIVQAEHPEIRRNAETMGRALRDRSGVARAVRIVESRLCRDRPRELGTAQ